MAPHSSTPAPPSSPARSFVVAAKLPHTDIFTDTFSATVDIPTNEQQVVDVGAAGDDVAAHNPTNLDLENSKVTVII